MYILKDFYCSQLVCEGALVILSEKSEKSFNYFELNYFSKNCCGTISSLVISILVIIYMCVGGASTGKGSPEACKRDKKSLADFSAQFHAIFRC